MFWDLIPIYAFARRKYAMKKEKKKIHTLLTDDFGVPSEMLVLSSEVSVVNKDEVTVEQCRGILLYENEEIRLKLPKFVLGVHGSALTLKSYYGTHVTIKGNIDSLVFDDVKDD